MKILALAAATLAVTVSLSLPASSRQAFPGPAAADQAKLVGAFVDEVKAELGYLQAENAELRARLKITAAERDAEAAAAADLRKLVEAK